MIPASRYSCLCVFPFPWIRAGPTALLLMNRIQQKWWAVTLKISYKKTLASVLHALSFSPVCLLYCELLSGEVHMVRNCYLHGKKLLSPANSQPGPAVSQQPCGWVNPPLVKSWHDYSLGQYLAYSFVRDPKSSAKPCPYSWPMEIGR